uniref:Uncharacterized protein n=1 Tax=Hippocampus comes TaxID=109280 RepID=A0A3Q2XX07_HIPCM
MFKSELVSGFNTEYRRGGFALIFIAEYARILFIRMLFIFTSVFKLFDLFYRTKIFLFYNYFIIVLY